MDAGVRVLNCGYSAVWVDIGEGSLLHVFKLHDLDLVRDIELLEYDEDL